MRNEEELCPTNTRFVPNKSNVRIDPDETQDEPLFKIFLEIDVDIPNYRSWESRMLLYIKGMEHGKLLVDSVLNRPFQYRTMVEHGNETTLTTIRARTYTDLTNEEKIRESVDIKATKIVLQGLPQDVYNLVNHNEHAKEI
ncbi:hypothetical protein Tco_0889598 [Tanacetum coccineum]